MKKIIVIVILLFILLIETYGMIKYDNIINENDTVIKSINSYIKVNSVNNENIKNIENDYLLLKDYKSNKNSLSIFEIKIFIEYIFWDNLKNTAITTWTNTITYKTKEFDNIIKIKKSIELFEKKWYITYIQNNKIQNLDNEYETIFVLKTENIRTFLKTLEEKDKRLKEFYKLIE